MITREQVLNIISAGADDIFAQRLAAALDALGLIQFCDIKEPDLEPRGDTTEQQNLNPERRDRSADRG